MKERIAKVLGWTLEETNSFSWASLRELVRPVDPKLADEISAIISDPAHLMSWLYK